MNAISIANNLFQLTTSDKNLLTVAVLAFGMLCIYRMIGHGDWFSKLLGVLLLATAVYVLTGCNGPVDPLGATSRTRLRTDASVSIAQSDAQARIAEAQAEEAARIAQANAAIITEQSRQNGETARTMAWAGMIPFALLIVGAAIVVGLVVHWQGRIWYERTKQQAYLPQLTNAQVRLLYEHASRTGQRVIEQEGQYYLTDGQRTVKALLKG